MNSVGEIYYVDQYREGHPTIKLTELVLDTVQGKYVPSKIRYKPDLAPQQNDADNWKYLFSIGEKSATSGIDDLLVVKKANTGSSSTEIHVLSAASNYQTFVLQTGTALHETGANFDFCAYSFFSGTATGLALTAIKMDGSGTGTTELHVVGPGFYFPNGMTPPGPNLFEHFSLQTGTAIPETPGGTAQYWEGPQQSVAGINLSANSWIKAVLPQTPNQLAGNVALPGNLSAYAPLIRIVGTDPTVPSMVNVTFAVKGAPPNTDYWSIGSYIQS